MLLDDERYYKLDTIRHSERRVMTSLHFKLNTPSPYLFVEILLEVLGHNEPEIEISVFYLIACKVLEAFYYQRRDIYDRLYECFTGRTRETKSDR